MREIFSFIFDMATDPLGLPVEWYWEWLILAVVGHAAYKIAYRVVGNLYRESWIGDKTTGSILHWIIRFIIFVIIWAVIYGVIWLAKFITSHWVIVISVIIGILFALAVVFLILHLKKKRA